MTSIQKTARTACVSFLFVGAGALGACASFPDAGGQSARPAPGVSAQAAPAAAAPAVTPPADGPMLSALPSQQLPGGSCGTMLWSASEAPELVFFAQAGAGAKIAVDGADVALRLVSAEGESVFGQRAQRTYSGAAAGGRAYQVSVSIETDFDFDGGAYVPRGHVRLADQSGWDVVTPVVGLVGCRN